MAFFQDLRFTFLLYSPVLVFCLPSPNNSSTTIPSLALLFPPACPLCLLHLFILLSSIPLSLPFSAGFISLLNWCNARDRVVLNHWWFWAIFVYAYITCICICTHTKAQNKECVHCPLDCDFYLSLKQAKCRWMPYLLKALNFSVFDIFISLKLRHKIDSKDLHG